MIGLIILISIVFVEYIVFKIVKNKKVKYVLSPIISILYGIMLFFVGMGIGSALFFVLAIIPLIVCVLYIIKQNYIKNN